MHFTIRLFIVPIILALSTIVHASLSLSKIQALVGFPQACTDAYNTSISECDNAHFNNGQLCSCSSACSSALDSVTITIINACQGTGASPNTLIGLFFDHAATTFLCTPPANGGGGGGCGTGASGSSSRQPNVSSSASSTTMTMSPTSSTTTTNSSSTHSAQSSISTTMATSSATLRSSTTSSVSTTSKATTKLSSNGAKPTTGGGSPFDISSGTGRMAESPRHTVSVLLMFAVAIKMVLS